MKEKDEQITYIVDYLNSYKRKITYLNKRGLFNAAKFFEDFASEVLFLYFNKKFHNLNGDGFSFEYVDLISEDGETFCQVSTCKNVPSKINRTLKKLTKSKKELLLNIKKVIFFVLDNESVSKIKDIKIGAISFSKKDCLITTDDVVDKALKNKEFKYDLFKLLKRDEEVCNSDFNQYEETCHNSILLMDNDIIDSLGGSYVIDRKSDIDKISENENKYKLIIGQAGSGKSALCKRYVLEQESCLYLRADALPNSNNCNSIWNFNFDKVFKYLNKKVTIFIDSLEYLCEQRAKLNVLSIICDKVKQYENLELVCSCRASDLTAFIQLESKYCFFVYEVFPISKDEKMKIAQYFSEYASIINNPSYAGLFNNLFNIDALLRLNNAEVIQNVNDFRKIVWEQTICKNNLNRERIVESVVFERSKNFLPDVSSDGYDFGTVKELISDGIFVKNGNRLRTKYDIFEDICFERYIDNCFDDCRGDYASFYETIEALGKCVNRRYQIWIENKIMLKESREKFLFSLLNSDKLPIFWKKQTEIGLIKSSYSKSFFDEYENQLSNISILNDFINLTNLHAFELKSIDPGLIRMNLQPIGVGRECLIHFLHKSDTYQKDASLENKIIKLINDYLLYVDKDKSVCNEAASILCYFAEKNKNKDDEWLRFENMKDILHLLYKLNDFCHEWIIDFWTEMERAIKNDEQKNRRFAIDVIADIICPENEALHKNFFKDILHFNSLYYWGIDTNSKGKFFHRDYDNHWEFGLNEYAEEYEHKSFNKRPEQYNCIAYLFFIDFWKTVDWIIERLNFSITAYSKNRKIHKTTLYFYESKTTKSYYHEDWFWFTGLDCNIPKLLSDLIYELIKFLSMFFSSDLSQQEKKEFAIRFKKYVFQKTNNTIAISVLSYLGKRFINIVPDYNIDIISSIDLVLADIRNYPDLSIPFGECFSKYNKRIPGAIINDRYSDICINGDLRFYATQCQISYPELVPCFNNVFDYLYSKTNNNEIEGTKYLQIEMMDIRKQKIYRASDDKLLIVSEPTGEAKKIADKQEAENSKYNPISEGKLKIEEKKKSGTLDLDSICALIETILSFENDKLFFAYTKDLSSYISTALEYEELEENIRNKYIGVLLKLFNEKGKMKPIIVDSCSFLSLLRQLKGKIDTKFKNAIKKLALTILLKESPFYKNDNELLSCIVSYFKEDETFRNSVVNTILMISRDEIFHQKYNFDYLKENKYIKDKDFVPNRFPSYKHSDAFITEKNGQIYRNHKNSIISEYLFNEKELNISSFNINDYDIEILSYAFICFDSLESPLVKNISEQFVKELIEIEKGDKKSYGRQDILSFDAIYNVQKFLQRNYADGCNYKCVLDILFDDIKFNLFTEETIDFYLDILCFLTPKYYDAYDNKEERLLIEKIICSLEKRISGIPDTWVKSSLYKAVVFGTTQLTGLNSDWSKYKTNYKLENIMFINDKISKYGHLNYLETLKYLYKMNYKALMPHILNGVFSCTEAYISANGLVKFNENYSKIKIYLSLITYTAFTFFDKTIKNDKELTQSFEGILDILISQNDERSAILLDEFRIH